MPLGLQPAGIPIAAMVGVVPTSLVTPTRIGPIGLNLEPGPLDASHNGWAGFYGSAWYNDPAEDMTTIIIMQRAHMGDQRLPMWHDFWTAVYQAMDD